MQYNNIDIFTLCTDFASPYFVFSLYQKFLLCCGSDFDFNEVLSQREERES